MHAQGGEAAEALRKAVNRAVEELADAPPNMVPQLVGVITKGTLALERVAPPPPATDAAPWSPDPECGHPELPALMPLLPGPPWDPWRGMSRERRTELEDEQCARAALWHAERSQYLRSLLYDPTWLTRVAAQLEASRLAQSQENAQEVTLHEAPAPGADADPLAGPRQGQRPGPVAVDNSEAGRHSDDHTGRQFDDQESYHCRTDKESLGNLSTTSLDGTAPEGVTSPQSHKPACPR